MDTKAVKKLLTGYGVELSNLYNRIEDEFTELSESDLPEIENYLDTLTAFNCYWAIWQLQGQLTFAVGFARRRQAKASEATDSRRERT